MAVSYLIAELLKSVMSLECVAKANGIESIVNQIFSHTSNYINLFLVTTVLTIIMHNYRYIGPSSLIGQLLGFCLHISTCMSSVDIVCT